MIEAPKECEHERTELRRRVVANGAVQYVYQSLATPSSRRLRRSSSER